MKPALATPLPAVAAAAEAAADAAPSRAGSEDRGGDTTAARCGTVCTHSIGARLSQKLALVTMLVLGLLSLASWLSIHSMIQERNVEDVQRRSMLLANILELEARSGGEAAVRARLASDAAMRDDSRLQVWRADGSLLHADALPESMARSQNLHALDFTIRAPALNGGGLRARLEVDCTLDAERGRRWMWILVLATLGAGAGVAAAAYWHVQRALGPLRELAAQTRAIEPGRLDRRLSLTDPGEELLPWIEQFNALMQRLERAYQQLEAFNADVAHELRTPLATLIGETELALARERSNDELRDTLASNLEEMQRLTGMVNDMLFLAQADRGAQARRGAPVSLAALAAQVAEFHEAPLADAGLTFTVEGDARIAVDEALLKRAFSNLISNATRFAQRGSTVQMRIDEAIGEAAAGAPAREVQVLVQNQGPAIPPAQLPRLFDRFYRGDDSRCCPDEQHHGLGLAIVAAIARMHAGRTLAHCEHGQTRVGFTLAAA